MSFKTRASGITLRRPALEGNFLHRRLERAIVDPHDASERFDPEFMLGMVCSSCGKAGMATRKDIRAAISDHVMTKHADDRGAVKVAVVYPKQ